MKEKNNKSEVYIRSDGWVFTEDGMSRLKAGGYKGFNRFKENIEAKIGKWHRVSKPLDRDAAAAVKSVKGMIPRAEFVSNAIVNEVARRTKFAKHPNATTARSEDGASSPCEFMRLTLTDDANLTVQGMDNREFRAFVSDAILRAAKKRK
jgi:hypothetical protein